MFATGKIDWTRLDEEATEEETFQDIHNFLAALPSKPRELKFTLVMPYTNGTDIPTVEFRSWLRSDLIKVIQQLEHDHGNPDLTQQELLDLIKEDVR